MRNLGVLLGFLAFLTAPALARHTDAICGTTRETARETVFLHRQSMRNRAFKSVRAPAAASAAANQDIGNIAVISDGNGVVARQNQFDLDHSTITFTPAAASSARYRYAFSGTTYDAAAAAAGTALTAFDDDASRLVTLPFPFSFYGSTYNQVYINSDGNLTFVAADHASSERSLGRMAAGPPRISPLFDDLDPSQAGASVRVAGTAASFIVTWLAVPEWVSNGIGARQTFQVRLFPDGRIEFAYAGATAGNAVVGIAPGNLNGAISLVSFNGDPSGEYPNGVAERFADTLSVDLVAAAQKFYQTHDDSYDYLLIYNNENIAAMSSAVAFENTVRNNATGFAVEPVDMGALYGSPARLQSIINMGPLSNYQDALGQPYSPNAVISLRSQAGDTPVTVMAHEAGHLFLAFASVRDPQDANARPMLNPSDDAHWSFAFNSDASLLEGERIEDSGPAASPRFRTVATVEAYSELDQYLMGFLLPSGVPTGKFFLVNGAPSNLLSQRPRRGVTFNGTRQDINVADIVNVEGRRTPDATVAQRRFRFGIVMVVPDGASPSAAELAQVESYRARFEEFFAQATSNRAAADATLRRGMKLSLFPASGVVAGASRTAVLTLANAASAEITVRLQAPLGFATVPADVKIPAGATGATFNVTGVRAGVEEILAVPGDSSYETASARLQVTDPAVVAAGLKLLAVSGHQQISTGAAPLPDPIVVRLTDANNLPYAGARILATPSTGGSVDNASVLTDALGQASFRWTPGAMPVNTLRIELEAAPAIGLSVTAGAAVSKITSVVSAASFNGGMAAGSLATLWGVNLAGGQTLQAGGASWPASLGNVTVALNGSALPLLYVSDTQVNFYVPQSASQGSGTLVVAMSGTALATTTVNVLPVLPGIFSSAVLKANTTINATTTPVRAGDYIEIYCTGLGATARSGSVDTTLLTPVVFIGATPLRPVFSGLAPGYVGLYQVNVQVPSGLAAGTQPLSISVGQVLSNEVGIMVQ